jgi:threonyl-tRNA synthetase
MLLKVIIVMIVCFYYFKVSNLDYPVVENIMKSIVKEKQDFERLELRKEDLLEMFKVNYKARRYLYLNLIVGTHR